jgi:hypothetical protein
LYDTTEVAMARVDAIVIERDALPFATTHSPVALRRGQ